MSEGLKAALLKGTARTEDFYVPELEREVTVRPLTDGEMSEATVAGLRGQVAHGRTDDMATGEMDVHIDKSAEGQALARRIKVAYGLSISANERWTPKEVAKLLPPGAVRRIAAKVDEMSGGDELAKEARAFRGDSGGPDDGDPASDGDAAGDDAS